MRQNWAEQSAQIDMSNTSPTAAGTSRRTVVAKLTQKDASAAAARHEMLYSGRMGGARAVFAFCDLSGLDLSGRNLADADFTGALLEECNLVGARLEFSQFFRRRPAPRQPRQCFSAQG